MVNLTEIDDLMSSNIESRRGKRQLIVAKLSDLDRGIIGLFRKKPVVVKAMRLTEPVMVKTLEGDHLGNIGDWLIEGVKGEVYPCRPDIFEATYEGFSSVDTELMKVKG